MRAQYSEMIEQLTGRKVLAYISQVHMEPDLTVQAFVIDGPVPGYGALELVHPEQSQTGEMFPLTVEPGEIAPRGSRGSGSNRAVCYWNLTWRFCVRA
jgi:hypothetical protein